LDGSRSRGVQAVAPFDDCLDEIPCGTGLPETRYGDFRGVGIPRVAGQDCQDLSTGHDVSSGVGEYPKHGQSAGGNGQDMVVEQGDGATDLQSARGMTGRTMQDLYRLMAIAKYDERYVVPKAHEEQGRQLDELACSLDYDEGPGMYGPGAFGEASGRPVPVAVETFHALRQRQTTSGTAQPGGPRRVNLLNWDGNGVPEGLFPPPVERTDEPEDFR
jgi:hypothetical protein